MGEIPQWMREALRTVQVNPLMPGLFGHLPLTIHLELEAPQGEPLPPSVATLVKISRMVQTLQLDAVHELPPGEPCVLEAASSHARLRTSGEPLERGLESLVDLLFGRLIPPESLGKMLRRLAYEGTTASTLQAITTHMLGTYDIDKALYVMLSGITAGFSLGFNRAVFFIHDTVALCLRGKAAIGPASVEEAHQVWEALETVCSGMGELIAGYDPDRPESPFQCLVKGIEIPLAPAVLEPEDEVLRALARTDPVHFRPGKIRNPHLARLCTNGEFVLAAVRAHRRLQGMVFADDDYYLPGSIDSLRLRHLEFFIDQTALVLENLELLDRQQELARRDPLTGALNRRELESLLPPAAEAAARAGKPLALLMVDVDGFKEINDQRGHTEGDRILRGVHAVAQAVLRAEDIVARFGGDEFVLLLKGADRQAATAVAERVRDRVRARLGITVSIGLAVLPADAISASELFVVADRRMFEAKRAGRDRLVGG